MRTTLEQQVHPNDLLCAWQAMHQQDMTLLTMLQMLCSWLPLSLGGATYYLPACPAMSYFLVTGDSHVHLWYQQQLS